ncbi:diaminopimelate epimerase [Rhodocaloribacter litoris]|uniref:diaminopimelate epimerase n=1 Tax=Rhodocaloribacter litoris TaxID=2558931 RepID=UPI0014207E9F|nr:diaminopimelate epimerase [Rhodocaloribacter litoris]
MITRKLIVEFTKMSGAGNDFIVIDNRFFNFHPDELAALARRWCRRRTGIGADGLLALEAPAPEGDDFFMRYLNADGSPAMCGNGARCLARFARMAGIDREELVFGTVSGRYRARVPADPEAPVRLFMPPFEAYHPDRLGAGEGGPADYIWTGTHHAVCRVPSVATVPVTERGAAIRHAAAFAPDGTNVNFVEVVEAGGETPARLRVRTFEKGVEAETLACGTGATAAALVARLRGWVAAGVVEVRMPGGVLTVGWNGPGMDGLYLEGPAVVVYRGTFEVDPRTLQLPVQEAEG